MMAGVRLAVANHSRKRWLGLLSVVVVMGSCMNQNPGEIFYADGCGNVFLISPHSVQYDPVKPAESSTGMYDGGEPAVVPVGKDDYRELMARIDAAIERESVHIQDRVKGSGLIRLPGTGKTYIIEMHANERAAIEEMLHRILGR